MTVVHEFKNFLILTDKKPFPVKRFYLSEAFQQMNMNLMSTSLHQINLGGIYEQRVSEYERSAVCPL